MGPVVQVRGERESRRPNDKCNRLHLLANSKKAFTLFISCSATKRMSIAFLIFQKLITYVDEASENR